MCQHQCRAGEEENIKNFGVCSGTIEGESVTLYKDESMPNSGRKKYVTETGCIPDILGEVWLDTQANCCVGDEEELTVGNSFLACSHGGFIEIQSSGREYDGDLDDGEITSVDHSAIQ